MQRYKYECDAGCLVLQTDVGEFNIHNEYGDGQFDLTILDADDEHWPQDIGRFLTTFTVYENGKVNVMNYDCSNKQPLAELNQGFYSVHSFHGNITIIPEA